MLTETSNTGYTHTRRCAWHLQRVWCLSLVACVFIRILFASLVRPTRAMCDRCASGCARGREEGGERGQRGGIPLSVCPERASKASRRSTWKEEAGERERERESIRVATKRSEMPSPVRQWWLGACASEPSVVKEVWSGVECGAEQEAERGRERKTDDGEGAGHVCSDATDPYRTPTTTKNRRKKRRRTCEP